MKNRIDAHARHCSRPAASDPDYTLNCEEPTKDEPRAVAGELVVGDQPAGAVPWFFWLRFTGVLPCDRMAAFIEVPLSWTHLLRFVVDRLLTCGVQQLGLDLNPVDRFATGELLGVGPVRARRTGLGQARIRLDGLLFGSPQQVPDNPQRRLPQRHEQRAPFGVPALFLVDCLRRPGVMGCKGSSPGPARRCTATSRCGSCTVR